ncbi:MAG: LysR family transcriptional regulator [Woeseiaceae bacterium]|nr:LysR family transcriptional regulator [Woeseiaceae bacterium]
MDRDLLPHLPIVLAVAKRGGFAAAAAELNTSPSNVSHAIRVVEKRLGMPLFSRTTRSVSLTEAGAAFVQSASGAIQEINAAWESLQSQRTGAAGLLRINTPRIALPWFLRRVLRRMNADYPDVTVEFFFDDGLSDVVAQGFDAGIRLGHMIAEDMIAIPLAASFRAIIVASPEYLSERGTPTHISDLQEHNCIQYRMTSAGNIYRWEVRDKNHDIQIETKGRVVVNDMLIALDLARTDCGLCYTFEPLAATDIESGALIEVLARNAFKQPGVSCYYPRRAANSPKLRAFIDTARTVFAATR